MCVLLVKSTNDSCIEGVEIVVPHQILGGHVQR